MSETADRDQMDQALFMSLVMMLSTSAMQHLGKMVNPMTGKAEVNLDGASASIDMLEMISRKTAGNLTAEEDRLMGQTISAVQLNFVETSAKESAAPVEDKSGTEPDKSDETPAEAENDDDKGDDDKPDGDPPVGEPKDPKFHKSYE